MFFIGNGERIVIAEQKPQAFADILEPDTVVLLVCRTVIAVRTTERQAVVFFQLHEDANERLVPVTDSMLEGVLYKRDKEQWGNLYFGHFGREVHPLSV